MERKEHGMTQIQNLVLLCTVSALALGGFGQLGSNLRENIVGRSSATLVGRDLVEPTGLGSSHTDLPAPTEEHRTLRLRSRSEAAVVGLSRFSGKVAKAFERMADPARKALRDTGRIPRRWWMEHRGLGNRLIDIHPDIAKKIRKIPGELLNNTHGWQSGDDGAAQLLFVQVGRSFGDGDDLDVSRISVVDGIKPGTEEVVWHVETRPGFELGYWDQKMRKSSTEGAQGLPFDRVIRRFADAVASDDEARMQAAFKKLAKDRDVPRRLRESLDTYLKPAETAIEDAFKAADAGDDIGFKAAIKVLKGELDDLTSRGWLFREDLYSDDFPNFNLRGNVLSEERLAETAAHLKFHRSLLNELRESASKELVEIRRAMRDYSSPGKGNQRYRNRLEAVRELVLDGELEAPGRLADQLLLDELNKTFTRRRLVFYNGGRDGTFLRKVMRERLIRDGEGLRPDSPARLTYKETENGRIQVTGGERSVYRLYRRLGEAHFSIKDFGQMYLYDPIHDDLPSMMQKLGLEPDSSVSNYSAESLQRVMIAAGKQGYLPDDYGAILAEQLFYRSVSRQIAAEILPTIYSAEDIKRIEASDPEFSKLLDTPMREITLGALDFETTDRYAPQAVQMALVRTLNGEPVGEEMDLLVKPVRYADPDELGHYEVISIEEGAAEIHGITDELVEDAPTFLEVYDMPLDELGGRSPRDIMELVEIAHAYNKTFEGRTLNGDFGPRWIKAERANKRVIPEGELTPAQKMMSPAWRRSVIDPMRLYYVVSYGGSGRLDIKRAKGVHTLGAAYESFFGRKLEGAHDALVDVKAADQVLWAMINEGLFGENPTLRDVIEIQNGLRAPEKLWKAPPARGRRGYTRGRTGKAVSVHDGVLEVRGAGGKTPKAWTAGDK